MTDNDADPKPNWVYVYENLDDYELCALFCELSEWLAEGVLGPNGVDTPASREKVEAQCKEILAVIASRQERPTDAPVPLEEAALRAVDKQVPDAIGNESYVIGPGALYKVREALYGSGGPRLKDE